MSKLEQTLILLKPDTLARGLCGEVLRRFEAAGLRIIDARQVRLTAARLHRHYAELRAKNPSAFDRTTESLRGKHVIAIRLAGRNAIAKTRALIGPTDPLAAAPGTIRGDLSDDSLSAAGADYRGVENLVHGSDSPTTARRELRLWFG